ncbi:hypothetical protein Dimus_018371 [Dionaea muscipula]
MMKTTMEEERGRAAKARTLIEKRTILTAPEVDPLLLKAIKNQDGHPLVRIGTLARRDPNGSHVASTLSGLKGVELLDTLVTYLWCVHGVNYYGMTEVAEVKGLWHVRAEGKNSEAKDQA